MKKRSLGMTLRSKLMLLSIPWMLAILVIAAFASKALVESAYQDREDRIKRTSHAAYKIVEYFGEKEKHGILKREDAQMEAVKLIGSLSFSDDEYVWINTYKGVIVSHPNQKLIGEDMWDAMDPGGKALFHEFSRVAQSSGADLVAYLWPRPGFDKPVKKLSFIQGYAPWEWVIGTGLYVDDIEAAEDEQIFHVAAITLVPLVLSGCLCFFLIRRISDPIVKLTDAMHRLAERDYSASPPSSSCDGELREMAEAFVAIRENAIGFNQSLIERQATIDRLKAAVS